MFTKRFAVKSNNVTRIISIGVKQRNCGKCNGKKLLKQLNSDFPEEKRNNMLYKLVKSKIDALIEMQENTKTFEFSYSITNGQHKDKFNLEMEQNILKGRLNKGLFESLTIDNKFYSEDLIDEAALSYLTHIITTVVSKFKKSPIKMDDIDIQIFELQ